MVVFAGMLFGSHGRTFVIVGLGADVAQNIAMFVGADEDPMVVEDGGNLVVHFVFRIRFGGVWRRDQWVRITCSD